MPRDLKKERKRKRRSKKSKEEFVEEIISEETSSKDNSKKKRSKKEDSTLKKADPEELVKKPPRERAFIRMIEKAQKEAYNNDQARAKKQPKKKGFAKINEDLKYVNPAYLSKEIKGYGYNFELGTYIKKVALILIAMLIASAMFRLHWYAIIALALIDIVAYPMIILAQFKQTSNNNDFEQIVMYLDQMIISFKGYPKILTAMKVSNEMLEGKMHNIVQQAIDIIETDVTSPNVYKRAFALIEDEYKCSRIRTLHRFMLTVESENSIEYQDSMDTLYSDVRKWQTRTYKFQKDLADTKAKITILLAGSIGIAALFSYILKTVETSAVESIDKKTYLSYIQAGQKNSVYMQDGNYFKKLVIIVDNPVYQWATVIFFLCMIIIYTVLNTKIHGNWLVKDIENTEDVKILGYMHDLALEDPVQKKKNSRIAGAVIGGLFIAVAAILFIFDSDMYKLTFVLGAIMYIVVAKLPDLNTKTKFKAIERNIKQEFPLWMRDIAINLKNRVVVRAIDESLYEAPYTLKPFLWNFLANIELDPTSIAPYMTFLGKYSAQELSTAVKTLYSVRILDKHDSQRQINDLIERNQELLAEAEKMRNEDSISGVSMLSLLPMVIMSFLLMVYMVIMLVEFMSLVGSAM